MGHKEKAFIYASILLRVEEEKRESNRAKMKGGRRR